MSTRLAQAACLTLALLYVAQTQKVAELERKLQEAEQERDQLRDARLAERREFTVQRITGEGRVYHSLTLAGALRLAGLKDVDE